MKDNTKRMLKNIFLGVGITIIVTVIALGIAIGIGIKVISHNGEINIYGNLELNDLNNFLSKQKVIFKEQDIITEYTFEELGITNEIKNITDDNFKYDLYINIDKIDKSFDTKELNNKLSELNIERTENIYAGIEIKEGKLNVVEEKQGDYLNITELEDYIINNINSKEIEINLQDYYYKMDTSKITSEELKKEVDKFNNFNISYTNGYVLRSDNLLEYIIVKDNKIIFNEDFYELCFDYIDNTLEKEIISYDTVGGTWNFTKHNGEQIQVSGGTWGDYFESDAETKFVIEQFKKFESVSDRVPIMSQDMEDTIPSTYIEISLDEQYLWYYENGELKLESKVVTGTKGHMDTPKGVYFVSEKINGKYLTGPGYRTWVNKWMRITNRGHGLHDASWRGSFGGKIYTYDGSHGCINLPKKFAYTLYDTIKVKECVVIY